MRTVNMSMMIEVDADSIVVSNTYPETSERVALIIIDRYRHGDQSVRNMISLRFERGSRSIADELQKLADIYAETLTTTDETKGV